MHTVPKTIFRHRTARTSFCDFAQMNSITLPGWFVANTTNTDTILPTEWWASPKMNIEWQQVLHHGTPKCSKERTKNAQFIVISLRNHMPLVVSNWWFPDISCRKTVCPIPVSLDTLECRWRHANNSGHSSSLFHHRSNIRKEMIDFKARQNLCRSTSALFYTFLMRFTSIFATGMGN